MTLKTKQSLRALVEFHGLRIKYVSDLPGKVAGFLDPSKGSRTIVVNANKTKSDHAFTIAHEIAHFILHYERSHRIPLPRYLKRRWKFKPMMRFSRLWRRAVSRKFDEERQADMWAICALLQIGAGDDLQAILILHPQKTGSFWLCVVGAIFAGIKNRIRGVVRRVFSPFAA